MLAISQEEVDANLGGGLSVTTLRNGSRLRVSVRRKSDADCILHWGLSRRPGGPWRRPPSECWPEGSTAAGAAVRTPFPLNDEGDREVSIHLDAAGPWQALVFVVHLPGE